MGVRSAINVLSAGLAVLLGSSCHCGSERLGRASGVLAVAGANGAFGQEATVDFGAVRRAPASVAVRFRLKNVGRASLSLVDPVAEDPDAVKVGTASSGSAPFGVESTAGRVIEPDEAVEVMVTFIVPAATPTTDLPHDFAGGVTIAQADAADPEAMVVVHLRAKGAADPCDVAKGIDFGDVPVEGQAGQVLALFNPSELTVDFELAVPEPAGLDGAVFEVEGANGKVSLAPGEKRELSVRFSPEEARTYSASLGITPGKACPTTNIALTGAGTGSLLTVTPPAIDCGWAQPGTTRTRELSFENTGGRTVQITAGLVLGNGTQAGEFSLPDDSWGTTKSLELAAGQTVKRLVACTPASLGRKAARLDLASDIAARPLVPVPLAMSGGGPVIAVDPTTFDFGQVAYVTGATLWTSLPITISNRGTSAPGDEKAAALHVGQPLSTGGWGAPYSRTEPKNSTTQADEVRLMFPPTYSDSEGIVAVAGSDSATAFVVFEPKSGGTKRADLVIYSNDPDRPELRVAVEAGAIEVGPCQFSVTAEIDFGVVHATAPKTLGVLVTNTGSPNDASCLVSRLHLTPATPQDFHFAEAVDTTLLAPGERLVVPIEFAPHEVGTQDYDEMQGAFEANISSPSSPFIHVPLKGGTGPACIALIPSEIDFSVIAPGTQTASVPVKLLNFCAKAVTVLDVSEIGGDATLHLSGIMSIPLGGASVTVDGKQSCDRLHTTCANAIPPGTMPFSVAFAPQAQARLLDGVAVRVSHGNDVMSLVLPVRGKADSAKIDERSFVQGGGDSVDVLLLVGDPYDAQNAGERLKAAVPNFLARLTRSGNDFHIGAVAGGMPDWSTRWTNYLSAVGELNIGVLHPQKFLTATSSSLASELPNKFKLPIADNPGQNESRYWQAWRALTRPHVNGWNAGFLRANARLALLIVGTESDTGSQYPGHSLDLLCPRS